MDGCSGRAGEDEITAWMPHMACGDKRELKQQKLSFGGLSGWLVRGWKCKPGCKADAKFEATPIEGPTQACCASVKYPLEHLSHHVFVK
jgi:hypothetical protein